MPSLIDDTLVGREFPPTEPFEVTHDHVRAFAASHGLAYDGGPAPATYPIVLSFRAMSGFLDDVGVDLSRIVHGEQRFEHERPVVPGDVLTTSLTVSSLRQIGGNDIIGTTGRVLDAEGRLVCTTGATLVHRAGEAS